jgi:integrase
VAATQVLWIQTGTNMRKVNQPSKAWIVKENNGYWVIKWKAPDLQRARFGINRIKNLEVRQLYANRIIKYINGELDKGIEFKDTDPLPLEIQPPAFDESPAFVDKNTLLHYFDRFIVVKSTEGVSESWLKKWRTLKNSLMDYAKEKGKEDYLMTELNKQWAVDYKAWRYSAPRSHGINTVAKDFSMLKQLLKEADVEDNLPVEKAYQGKGFKVGRVLTDMVAITGDQVAKLLALEGMSPYLERVRDNFVVACYCALRWGNWSITRHNVVDMKNGETVQTMLKLPLSVKTNDFIYIPLHPVAKRILEKYDYELPVISNQNSNAYIKIVAEKAKLTEMVTLKKSRAGRVEGVTKPFWKWITTHTARRTFVTIGLFEMKIPSALLMKITGHKTEKQLFEYARISSQAAAFELSKYF